MLTSDSYKYVVENKKEDRLQRVINFIIENFDREISLKELADISYMTTNSFCRFFKERTNKTAFEFIREYRISKACQMIINSNKTYFWALDVIWKILLGSKYLNITEFYFNLINGFLLWNSYLIKNVEGDNNEG